MAIVLSKETRGRLKQMMLPYENYELVIRRLLDSAGKPDTAHSGGIAFEVIRKRQAVQDNKECSREKLRQYLKEVKATTLARKLGLWHTTIMRWRDGEAEPRLENRIKLEEVTGGVVSAAGWDVSAES